MLGKSMSPSYVPDTLMKLLESFLPSIEAENPIVVLGRGRIQWARNALCKKYKTPTPRKGKVHKHTLKSSQQNCQVENQLLPGQPEVQLLTRMAERVTHQTR